VNRKNSMLALLITTLVLSTLAYGINVAAASQGTIQSFEVLGSYNFHYETEVALSAVHLESGEDTNASANLGTITFDGVSYSLPNDTSKAVGTYSAECFVDAIYMFYYWETTDLVSVSDANANPATVTVSGNGTLKAIYASHHIDHLNDNYVPMVIPVNGKNLMIAPVINCTILENNVYQPFHYPCKSAQTTLTDNDWSDGDANYTYVFEDWVDYDWNDIVVSLYATVNDTIDICARAHLDSRSAAWKNPFSVEITPVGMNALVYWNSTDYPEEHNVQVNSSEIGDIELFFESIPEKIAFIKIIPIILPEVPVGGYALPIDTTHFLAPRIDLTPRIGLASVLLAAMAVTVILIRRKKRR